jgi:hypothetical protein
MDPGATGCGNPLAVQALRHTNSQKFNRRVSNTRRKLSQSEQLADGMVEFEES